MTYSFSMDNFIMSWKQSQLLALMLDPRFVNLASKENTIMNTFNTLGRIKSHPRLMIGITKTFVCVYVTRNKMQP